MSLIGVRLAVTAISVALAAVPLTAPSAAAASPVCLSGTFQYDYQNAEAGPGKPTVTKPLRGAGIALWGAEKSTDSPRQLTPDHQYSAADGSFNLCYTPVTTTTMNRLWVRARSEHANLWKVDDYNANPYTLDSPTKTDTSGSASVGTVKPAGTAGRAWHAFDTVNLLWNARSNATTGCWTTREADSNACTQLEIRWVSGSTTGAFYDLSNRVYLRDTDPDSEHMVLHESAHFFLHRLYGGWWPDVNCANHYIQLVSSGSCAWTEGFADSAAAYLLGDSRFVWPDGSSREYVYGPGWHTGDQVQGNVDASLLDLWRNLDGGWSGTIGALTSNSPSTFSQYFKTVRPAGGLSTTGTALGYLNSHAINYGPTIVGDGKNHTLTNGGGLVMDRGAACYAAGSASVRLAASSPGSAQQTWWVRAPAADGTVKIFDGCPDSLALTAPYSAGDQVMVRAVSSSNVYQNWRIVQNGSGTYTLTNPVTGYVLDSASIDAGAAVTTGQASTANSQGWAALN
ncbi:RICIN domain-containing protein [Streptomyces sp. NPDC048717]|uniref:RICIN domain-containing protein n=1 Tax=Streptomyces sp. NPDC048717 TaxID=3154928 RepID=UPI003446E24B